MSTRREERYVEWLERLDIPVDETTRIEKFQEYLRREFDFQESQIEALTEALRVVWDELAPRGVRPIWVHYPWGRDLRFVIAGERGLFGWRTIKERFGIRTPWE